MALDGLQDHSRIVFSAEAARPIRGHARGKFRPAGSPAGITRRERSETDIDDRAEAVEKRS